MTATQQPTAAGTQADQVAVAALTQKVVAAWAYQDAESFASVFVDDGTMILAGVYNKGRDNIQAHMAAAFGAGEYKDTQVTGKPVDIRFLTPDVCLLLTEGGVLHKGESEVADVRQIRASWLAVKRDGQWQLAAYQNSPRNA